MRHCIVTASVIMNKAVVLLGMLLYARVLSNWSFAFAVNSRVVSYNPLGRMRDYRNGAATVYRGEVYCNTAHSRGVATPSP